MLPILTVFPICTTFFKKMLSHFSSNPNIDNIFDNPTKPGTIQKQSRPGTIQEQSGPRAIQQKTGLRSGPAYIAAARFTTRLSHFPFSSILLFCFSLHMSPVCKRQPPVCKAASRQNGILSGARNAEQLHAACRSPGLSSPRRSGRSPAGGLSPIHPSCNKPAHEGCRSCERFPPRYFPEFPDLRR